MIRIILKAETVEVILARRNVTRIQFAKKIGVTTEHFYALLAGRRCPSAEMREKILIALKAKSTKKWDDIFHIQSSEHR